MTTGVCVVNEIYSPSFIGMCEQLVALEMAREANALEQELCHSRNMIRRWVPAKILAGASVVHTH